MSKVIDLNQYRTQKAESRTFALWRKRFKEPFSNDTRMRDLSDTTLVTLALPGGDSVSAIYDLIMGHLGWGDAADFGDLDSHSKMRTVDGHLFLADIIRFELMRRLDWLEGYVGDQATLLELVEQVERFKAQMHKQAPELVPTHPEYERFAPLTTREKELYIRKMLPRAMEVFRRKLNI